MTDTVTPGLKINYHFGFMNNQIILNGFRKKVGLLLSNSLIRDTGLVYLVSVFQLLSSIIVNIFVPVVASKESYANYRSLILFAGYAGLLHLGLLNGLYLSVVGKKPAKVDEKILTSIFRALNFQQIIVISVAVLFLYLLKFLSINKFVLLGIIASWWLLNLVTYYNYLFQAFERFKGFAIVNIISLSIGMMLLLWIVISKSVSTLSLTISFVTPYIIAVILYRMIWSSNIGRHCSKTEGDHTGSKNITIIDVWKSGLVLFTANAGIAILFTSGSLFVYLLFEPEDFANYAFTFGFSSISYLLLDGLMSAMTPYISKSANSENKAGVTSIAVIFLIWITPLVYWIGGSIISKWYDAYSSTASNLLLIFVISLPFSTIIRTRLISITIANDKTNILLSVGVIGNSVFIILSGVLYALTNSINGIAIAWSSAIVVTAVFGEWRISKKVGNNTALERSVVNNAVIASSAFLLALSINQHYAISIMAYLCAFVLALYINWQKIFLLKAVI